MVAQTGLALLGWTTRELAHVHMQISSVTLSAVVGRPK